MNKHNILFKLVSCIFMYIGILYNFIFFIEYYNHRLSGDLSYVPQDSLHALIQEKTVMMVFNIITLVLLTIIVIIIFLIHFNIIHVNKYWGLIGIILSTLVLIGLIFNVSLMARLYITRPDFYIFDFIGLIGNIALLLLFNLDIYKSYKEKTKIKEIN